MEPWRADGTGNEVADDQSRSQGLLGIFQNGGGAKYSEDPGDEVDKNIAPGQGSVWTNQSMTKDFKTSWILRRVEALCCQIQDGGPSDKSEHL